MRGVLCGLWCVSCAVHLMPWGVYHASWGIHCVLRVRQSFGWDFTAARKYINHALMSYSGNEAVILMDDVFKCAADSQLYRFILDLGQHQPLVYPLYLL